MDNATNKKAFGKRCTNCGAKLDKNSEYCPSCGKVKDDSKYDGIERLGAGGVGYSRYTDDETFANASKKNRKAGIIVVFIIAVIIAVVLMIMGLKPIGAACVGAVMFIFISILVLLTTRKKKDWEGTVEKKVHHRPTNPDERNVFKIVFRTDSGKKVVQKYRSYVTVYDYLQEGDRVRYVGSIGGLFAYEKYDKSQDNDLLCVSCSSLQDPRNTYCSVCGSRLLKGE